MAALSLDERIKGSLLGAVIGAEIGYAIIGSGGGIAIKNPMEIFDLDLSPVPERGYTGAIMWYGKCTPFIDLGVKAYIKKMGRVTPEDFASLLMDNEEIARPIFLWDPIHTTQEALREGMNPRISGLGNVPCGYIGAAMPAVGIYHYGNPESAYIDGVDIASVNQPRMGADWAGLSAAAIAAAFIPDISPQSVADTALRIAHENNKELFYQLNIPFKWGGIIAASDEHFLNYWCALGTEIASQNVKGYAAYNPLGRILPLLYRYGSEPAKLLKVLSYPANEASIVGGIIAGAILGAMYGTEVFPEEWRKWAVPMTKEWDQFADVIELRRKKEELIVSAVDDLTVKPDGEKSILFDKVYGCILAGAIGNAMGSPVENQNYTDIDARYPEHVTTILNTMALENEDDNQMAMMLIETYLERDGYPVAARHFGETWKKKMNRDKFFVNCMGHCYDLINAGWDARITGHWTQVTGSAVMCIEPVGMYNIADPDDAYVEAKAISYMYQRGLDVVVASLLAGIAAEAFRVDATVESVCKTAIELAPDTPLNTFDKRKFRSVREYISKCIEIASRYDDVLAVRKELYDECLMYASIDPLEVIGLSLAIFRTADGDVRQAAIGGTNIGRDSDTISGRASMLTGIISGADAVPKDWIEMFKPQVLEKIKNNSRRLTDVIIKKNERMRARLNYY